MKGSHLIWPYTGSQNVGEALVFVKKAGFLMHCHLRKAPAGAVSGFACRQTCRGSDAKQSARRHGQPKQTYSCVPLHCGTVPHHPVTMWKLPSIVQFIICPKWHQNIHFCLTLYLLFCTKALEVEAVKWSQKEFWPKLIVLNIRGSWKCIATEAHFYLTNCFRSKGISLNTEIVFKNSLWFLR